MSNTDKPLLCDGCKFEIKKPCGVQFDCVDGSTYCASCFIDRQMINFGKNNNNCNSEGVH